MAEKEQPTYRAFSVIWRALTKGSFTVNHPLVFGVAAILCLVMIIVYFAVMRLVFAA
jgi:hypothetical protein